MNPAQNGKSPRRLSAPVVPYAVVLAAAVLLYYQADHFEFEQVSGRIGPGAWPKLILILMLATALWGLIANVMKWGRGGEEHEAVLDEAEDIVRPPEIHPFRVWIAVAATVAYLQVLPVFGFLLCTIVFSFGLMWLGEFRRPLLAAMLSVAIALCFMFLFMRVVYVALPLGIAPFDRVSYALMTVMGIH